MKFTVNKVRRYNGENTLGKRIKEARLAKKMTQSEVVGDFITRNMLSQIESGSATPSVKTLEYLCKVLEIEPNTLLPDENDSKMPLTQRAISVYGKNL